MSVLEDEPDIGFLQLSALNRPPASPTKGYYLHEVVAGWDGWSLSAPRPGLTIVHVEPPGPDGATEAVVDSPPDEPIEGAHTTVRVEPSSLPRLRYGTSYSFRVLAVDLAGNSVPQVPPRRRRPITPDGPAVTTARTHLERLRSRYTERDLAGVAATRREAVIEHLRTPERAVVRLPDELRSGDARIDATLAGLVAQAAGEQPVETAAQRPSTTSPPPRVLAESARDLAACGRSYGSTPTSSPCSPATTTSCSPTSCGDRRG